MTAHRGHRAHMQIFQFGVPADEAVLATSYGSAGQDSPARRCTSSKPNRPLTHRWPWPTSWSRGKSP